MYQHASLFTNDTKSVCRQLQNQPQGDEQD